MRVLGKIKQYSSEVQVHVDAEDKTSYLIQVSGSNYKAKTLFVNESGPFEVSGERWIISFPHVIYFVIYYPSYVSVLSKKVLVILCHQNENLYEQDYNFFIDHHPVGETSPPAPLPRRGGSEARALIQLLINNLTGLRTL